MSADTQYQRDEIKSAQISDGGKRNHKVPSYQVQDRSSRTTRFDSVSAYLVNPESHPSRTATDGGLCRCGATAGPYRFIHCREITDKYPVDDV